MKYRFVDKIISLDPGVSIQSQFTWPRSMDIFQDHFPGFAVVPGVLMTEMMGQTAALCLESARNEADAAILMQIKSALFRGWVHPDTCVDIHARILSHQKRIARVNVTTQINGKLMASAELLFAFESKDKLGLPETDPLLVDYRNEQMDTD